MNQIFFQNERYLNVFQILDVNRLYQFSPWSLNLPRFLGWVWNNNFFIYFNIEVCLYKRSFEFGSKFFDL